MTLTIRKATEDDVPLLSKLADTIWWPTYHSILSKEQITFMLERIYSVCALQQAMDSGQQFFLAYEQDHPVGFIAVKPKDQSVLRIEKLYLLPMVQGKGYGRNLIDHATQIAQENRLNTLELNVNRGNNAYRFYLKEGFEVIEEIDIPYHGFVLDDYVMRKVLLLP